ncbi:MAG: hypothetical protein M3430_20285 [Acidobacteriota bacterium]|nr:hypothetical protein [Acidobacteriota bacterium]
MSDQLITAESSERLRGLRRALLHLHKTLLDDERARFERVRGRIESSGAFLQLVLHDEWFAWLRPLSGLVVQIDELLDAEEATKGEAEALITQAHSLLKPEEGGEGLGDKYRAALQRTPEVVLAHAEASKLLGRGKGV